MSFVRNCFEIEYCSIEFFGSALCTSVSFNPAVFGKYIMLDYI